MSSQSDAGLSRPISWLTRILERARDEGWCTRVGCTTCAADSFRRAVLSTAIERAGAHPPSPQTRLNSWIVHLPEGDRERVFQEIIAGLRGLDATAVAADGFRLLICDLEPPLLSWGLAVVLDDVLTGSPAGAELQRMRTHAAELARTRQRRREHQSPEAVRVRRESRRAEGLQRQQQRAEVARRVGEERARTTAELELLTGQERLEWIAEQKPGFPLEIIPMNLLPGKDEPLKLDVQRTATLIQLVDRRGGAWGRLATRLHRHLLHPAYFETRFRTPEPLDGWPRDFAIISAYATTGQTWTDDENREADRRLYEELRARGTHPRRVSGFSPETGHAEPSWAAVLSTKYAVDVGRTFRQDAVFLVRGEQLFVMRCEEPRKPVLVGGFRERLEHDPHESRAWSPPPGTP